MARVAVAVCVLTIFTSPALAQGFCDQYASVASTIAGEAIKRNPACLDFNKGVHAVYQMHLTWCKKNPRHVVEGAEANIRRLALACTQGRGNRGANQGPPPGGFARAPGGQRFCNQYASAVAGIAGDAIRQNPRCLDFSKGVHSSEKMHFDWCMKNPRAEVEGAENNIRRLVSRCTRGRP